MAEAGLTAQQARDLVAGNLDMWITGCLDFENSPHGEPGRPCGAPVWGCLDCHNAVFTSTRLPHLIRLLNHVTAQRQRLQIEVWRRNYGFAYARALQVINMFPSEEVALAMQEAAGDEGPDWTLSQLTHRIDAR